MAWVVDRSLDVLLAQINAAAPGRDKSSDGSIGDPAHAATVSAHNPQDTEDSQDGNDPDNQVDARDITHDPRFAGSDMRRVTEAIRLSKDRRVRIVIFNKRIFSSYANGSRPAWEWGPYSGDNDHSKHAHVETNDLHNDELQPWSIALTEDEMYEHHEIINAIVNGSTDAGFIPDDPTKTPIYPASTLNLRILHSKVDQLQQAVAALASAISNLPSGGGGSAPSAAQNAEAVADELAARLAE